jgi:hypothetical protein
MSSHPKQKQPVIAVNLDAVISAENKPAFLVQ